MNEGVKNEATVIIRKSTEEILKQLNNAENDWKGIRSDGHAFINPLEAVHEKCEIGSKLWTIRLRWSRTGKLLQTKPHEEFERRDPNATTDLPVISYSPS